MHSDATDDESRRRLRDMPVSRLFPNMVTIAGLCCGVSSIRWAMLDRWEFCVMFLIAAAILDAMDGMVARLLKATSNFGAQLDSLSDVICFGVCPAVVFHLWALQDFKRFGWAAVLFYIVCCALRLARFNTAMNAELRHPFQRFFFTGVPAPGGALLAITPLMMSFEGFHLFEDKPWLGALYLAFIGILMASRLPTIAIKHFRITQDYAPYLLIAVALFFAFVTIEPWNALPLISGLYFATMPISAYVYWRVVVKGKPAWGGK